LRWANGPKVLSWASASTYTEPPRPPSPPSGPPCGTYISRRICGEPSPPSPALTKILTRSNTGRGLQMGVAADCQARLSKPRRHPANADGREFHALEGGEQLLG